MEVVLASANPGKLRELTALLAPLGWRLRAQSELGVEPAEESGETFAANALIKARHAASRAGLAALADDSGIEVDALGGRPGVRSARYAREGASDRENLEKLLRELDGVPAARRSARYRCAIAYVERHDDPHPVIAQGCWEGRIAAVARGSGGFGYDPIFLPSGLGCTAAELAPAEKDRVSHRAQALAALLARMRGAPGN
ncbi:MAG TPA: RdgB/HAM1 family non-canonical purine NTP pyrophosphatase [Steroidobacteraceae bacterium]|nr:RdgB/HAM1 family non-canonical purine NTP pyrophosphatase [Steroidobacteraceae bacterium]